MKKILLAFISLFFIIPAAQAELYVEADPFAYGLNGHSIHIGVQGGGFRFQVGSFSAEIPDSFKDNDLFEVKQGGYGFKLDYYGKSSEGSFIGVEYGVTKAELQLKTGGETITKDINLLGLRAGYKMKFGNSFYVMPWVGVDKVVSNTDATIINGEEYKTGEVFVFPTVHLGFDF